MTKKRWHHDGPVMATGFGWDWRYLQTILHMSAERKKFNASVDELREAFDHHPELIPTEREMLNTPPEKLIARVEDQIKVFAREIANRERAFKENKRGQP